MSTNFSDYTLNQPKHLIIVSPHILTSRVKRSDVRFVIAKKWFPTIILKAKTLQNTSKTLLERA